MQKKKLSMLIFDFDGVLMDSVGEIAVTAYNMLKGTIVTRLDQLPQPALDLFLRNRFHVQPIGDAPVLMAWCLETDGSDPQRLLSEKEYDDIIRYIDEPVTVRTTRFFDTRARFKARDLKAWIALNKPVQPLWDRLIERRSSDLVMLTNKNREATLALCNHFGLQVNNANIYSGDNGTTKIDNMQQIRQRFKDCNHAFIDDSVKNLSEINAYFNKDKKAIALIFAEWGYTGPDDARLARDLGFQSLTIEKFIYQLQNKF